MDKNLVKVSVIIPVYNAEPFIRKAVESALIQEETAEVLLVEDCSTDNSINICKQLEQDYEKVKLFRHSDGNNHGAGASRNLGIEKASCDFVAFLDADDYYLPGRFKKDKEILMEDSTIDGVYNALGIEFYDESEEILENYKGRYFTTLTESVRPEMLFEEMAPFGDKGYFSCDTLTVRKSVFEKVGLFHSDLKISQDTHMRIKLAIKCRLAPGAIKTPVAIRGVHKNNRSQISNIQENEDKLYGSLFKWAIKEEIDSKKILKIWILYFGQHNRHSQNKNPIKRKISQLEFVAASSLMHPAVLCYLIKKYMTPNFVKSKHS